MNKEEKIINKIYKLIRRLFWIPFLLGFIGYRYVPGGPGTELLDFGDAVYAAATLYFVNPIVENHNILILAAELLAILVTTSFVLSALSKVFRSMVRWYKRIWPDSTTIYADKGSAWSEMLANTLNHGYIGGSYEDNSVEKTQDHIIMFDDDVKSLSFYNRNKDKFADKRVYIMLTNIDGFLLGTEQDKNVHYFNVNELVARLYWKRNNLYSTIGLEKPERPVRIALVGNTDVRKNIFKYAYLNNIYSLNQCIEYHIWGCELYEMDFLKNLELMNDDRIIIHEDDYRRDMKLMAAMDRVILTEEDSMPIMQELMYLNPKLQIHCYSPENVSFTRLYASDDLLVYGDVSDILTEASIKGEKLYRQAKLVNYDYCLRYAEEKCTPDFEEKMEEAWEKLDGFTKGSNIARADFYWIERKRLDEGADEEMIWRMEHIRWCRYHYFNRWEYADVPKKDPVLHKHPLLVPFDELPQREKEKDGIYDPVIKQEIIKLIDV